MEYVLIFALEAFGISLNVLQIVYDLDKKLPDDTLNDVFSTYFKANRISLLISIVLMFLNITIHYIVDEYANYLRDMTVPIPFTDISIPYILAAFIVAFLVGYFGQWILYRVLGRVKEVIAAKIDGKPQ